MKRILIIDDDPYIGTMLEEILTRAGYEILRAYSGTEAILLLSGSGSRTSLKPRPDLVLLDLMLPGLSGEEVLPRIKEIPVIVVSAKAGTGHKVDLLLGGAVDYVTKPFCWITSARIPLTAPKVLSKCMSAICGRNCGISAAKVISRLYGASVSGSRKTNLYNFFTISFTIPFTVSL